MKISDYRFQNVVAAAFVSVIASFFLVQSASAISVSPLKQTVTLDPGAEQIISIEIGNDTSEAIEVGGAVDAFAVDPDTGAALFGETSVAEKWVVPATGAVTVQPGGIAALSFIVSVPANAEPRSYYLSLFGETQGGDAGVAVGTRVGSLFFLNVAGVVREELDAEIFSASKHVYYRGPIDIDLQLRNTGTYHVLPTGLVTFTNAAGEEIAKKEINADGRTVFADMRLRDAVSLDELTWKDAGPVQARLRLHYGQTDQIIEVDTTVWFVPFDLIVAGAIGVLIVITAAILFRRKRRMAN